MRAFQIKVDVASGVSGFVMPDDHIDIYWTGVGGGNVNGEITRLIESAVRIIAVDQATGEGQGSGTVARTVTVAATPEQVARLAQARRPAALRCRWWPMRTNRFPVWSRWTETLFSASPSRRLCRSRPPRFAPSNPARAPKLSKFRSPARTEQGLISGRGPQHLGSAPCAVNQSLRAVAGYPHKDRPQHLDSCKKTPFPANWCGYGRKDLTEA